MRPLPYPWRLPIGTFILVGAALFGAQMFGSVWMPGTLGWVVANFDVEPALWLSAVIAVWPALYVYFNQDEPESGDPDHDDYWR